LSGRECLIGCADHGRIFIHYDRDRNASEHWSKFARAAKRLEEDALLELGQKLYGDATGDVHTAKSHGLQREVSRCRTKYFNPELQAFTANGTRPI
jgi:hypothetical protein